MSSSGNRGGKRRESGGRGGLPRGRDGGSGGRGGGSGSQRGGRTDGDQNDDSGKVCNQFQRTGSCSYGNRCRYSHGQGGSAGSAGAGPQQRPFEEFRRSLSTRKFAPSQAEHFLRTALTLIEGSSSDIVQKVIKDLASEHGLRHIANLVEGDYQLEMQSLQVLGFWEHCVPFLKIITHQQVRSSLVLESAIGTMYNVLYGISGARAIPFFRMVAQHLQAGFPRSATEQNKIEDYGNALCAAASALFMTLNMNQAAFLQTEFVNVAKIFRACHKITGEDYTGRVADHELRKVEQKLQIGESIPVIEAHKTDIATPYNFEREYDLPGEHSIHGPRHDNDKANITEIDILPTKDEILAVLDRTEYLPIKDFNPFAHHLPAGITRIIDTHFRLLREGTSGQLRDAVQHIVHSLAANPDKIPKRHNGAQTMIYRNIVLEEFKPAIRRFDGLHIDISFDQPNHIVALNNKARSPAQAYKARREWWDACRYLQYGALLCLVDQKQTFTFFTVAEREVDVQKNAKTNMEEGPSQGPPPPIRNLTENPHRAYITLKLVDPQALEGVVREFHRQMNLDGNDIFILPYAVEFPGLLFPSFQPILKFLKDITSIGTSTIPFSKLIAPEANHEQIEPDNAPGMEQYIRLDPPLYLAKRGTVLDLSCLSKTKPASPYLRLSVDRPCAVETLQEETTLDRGQAKALIAGLTTELALIQGPPGTGKSYVGLQIARVLLKNAAKLKLGPIICVTYTNHALDQFLLELLEEYKDKGEKLKLIRLGSRSKAPELLELRLRNATENTEATAVEKESTWKLRSQMTEIKEGMGDLCGELSTVHSWQTIRDFLENEHENFHDQLFGGNGVDSEGFQKVSYKKPHEIIAKWCRLSHLPPHNYYLRDPNFHRLQRPVEDLLRSGNLSLPNSYERLRILEYWEEQIRASVITKLTAGIIQFDAAKSEYDNGERERRCLDNAQIIGVTTTGLAGHAELLRKVNAKVLICEEAGEVLEAHTLTALLPSIQHAILIGDHQQLRPQIENYALSMASREGKKYALDESLFERLTREKYGYNKELSFPISTLDIQRRMHPFISDLVRQTLYPNLKDHERTSEYPEVDGMKKRLFWLNHSHLEANSDKSDPQQMSKSNDYEVEMTAALVKHLIKQGCNGKGSIAVITPYLGQLQKLRRRMRDMVEILVGEKDEMAMDLANGGEEIPIELREDGEVVRVTSESARKGTILDEVRISTVDNFQGEEAKIIIVSLVRCNAAHNVGFLKTSNRINVLLSRAKHGMYIIGSADSARAVPMWSDVLSLLSKGGNLGDELPLLCPRHPDVEINVNEPDHFLRFSPEGGCDRMCGKRLSDCGHACINKCHSDMLHNAVVCMEPCIRPLPGCSHPCVTPCGKKCAKCLVKIPEVPLPCGHVHLNVNCHQAQNPELIQCRRIVSKTVPVCGHEVSVQCHVDVTAKGYQCRVICGKDLPCGHQCKASCYECIRIQTKTAGTDEPRNHVDCKTTCGRALSACPHACGKKCHGAAECGLCDKPCEIRCSHSRCPKKCHEPCTPCAEACTWGCEHQGKCDMPCAVPCDILPCSKRCGKSLECGHQCPSICGEKCPGKEFCQTCAAPNLRESIVDYETFDTFGEVDPDKNPVVFLDCGHFFCMSTTDGLMQMKEVYDMLPGRIYLQKQDDWISKLDHARTRCPTCRGSLRNINRYNRVAKGMLIDIATKKFVESSHKTFLDLEKKADNVERELNASSTLLITEFPKAVREARMDKRRSGLDALRFAIQLRHEEIRKIQREIMNFINSVTKEEQPYGRILRLVENCIRRHPEAGVTNKIVPDDFSAQLRNGILATSLYLRVRWTHFMDLHNISELQSVKTATATEEILRTLEDDIKRCERLEVDATNAVQYRQIVEAKIFHARFLSLQFKVTPAPKLTLDLQPKAITGAAPDTATIPPNGPAIHEQPEQSAEEMWEIEKIRLRDKELASLTKALEICVEHPPATKGLKDVVVETSKTVERMGGVFYSPVSTEEQRQVFAAMSLEFRGTGHWYYCVNRHPFTIGNCGGAVELARCPQCDEPIGGQNYQPAAGVTRALDIEESFTRLRV